MRQSIVENTFKTPVTNASELNDQQLFVLLALAAGENSKSKSAIRLPESIQSLIDSVADIVWSSKSNLDSRLRLMPLLALQTPLSESAFERTIELLGAKEPEAIHSASLNLIRRLNDDRTPERLIKLWSGLLPDTRRSVCYMLLEKKNWGERFIAALEKEEIAVSDLDPSVAERLRSYGDRNLMARTLRLLGKPPASDRNQLVLQAEKKFPARCDANQGQLLFKEHCSVCHTATPDRPLVGPPIENLKNWSTQQWLVAILDPNRAIEPKYHQYAIVTVDGQTYSGLIEDRSSSALRLAGADGRRYEIAMSDIEQLKDLGKSLMPEGIENKLSAEQLGHLVAYLQTLSTPSK